MMALNILLSIVVLLGLFYFQKQKRQTLSLEQKFNENEKLRLQLQSEISLLQQNLSVLEKKSSESTLSVTEQAKLAEKNKRIWAMSEAVYKEKKKVDEELEKLNAEKEKLEAAKNKLDEKVKKLWQTSTAVHKEKERINTLKQEIEIKHREIVDSVTYAQRIQEAILPARSEINREIPENFILFKPRDIVSGDFYWFSQKGKLSIIACVDCTGHGVPGAFMSMIGNTLLNQIVNEKDITQPALILNKLNKEITNALKQDSEGSDSRDGMDIAICSIDHDKKILQYAGANRPLYFIRNAELTETKANKVAIGGHLQDGEKLFHNHQWELQSGDTFYLSTDGYADQFNPADKKLMTKRFKELLINIHQEKMENQHLFLDNFINDWKGSTEQTDDILVLGFRF
jgi:serine phosphatase RsbU (regulator of sigma subunit)